MGFYYYPFYQGLSEGWSSSHTLCKDSQKW
jgi:hypothetical protein